MQEILDLYHYIKNNYDNYQNIIHDEMEIKITFHEEFEMKIILQSFYKIYFNNIFYYDVDSQDIKDTVNDFLTHEYVFCQIRKHIKVMNIKEFQDTPKYIHVWTIVKTLK